MSQQKVAPMKTKTNAARLAVLALSSVALLSGCSSSRPLDTFSLQPASGQVSKARKKNVQLLIPTPAALKALDSENIVISSAPGSIAYLDGAQWGDRLTNIVQTKLVQSFQNSGAFSGVGRPGDGLAINYQVLTELRSFGVQTYGSARTATVEIAVRILNDKNGEVKATRVFKSSSAVSGTGNAAYVKALNSAFDQVSNEIVSWTVSVL